MIYRLGFLVCNFLIFSRNKVVNQFYLLQGEKYIATPMTRFIDSKTFCASTETNRM